MDSEPKSSEKAWNGIGDDKSISSKTVSGKLARKKPFSKLA